MSSQPSVNWKKIHLFLYVFISLFFTEHVVAVDAPASIRLSHDWLLEYSAEPVVTLSPNSTVKVRTTLINSANTEQTYTLPADFGIQWYLVDAHRTLAWSYTTLEPEKGNRTVTVAPNSFAEIIWVANVPNNAMGTVLASLRPAGISQQNLLVRVQDDTQWSPSVAQGASTAPTSPRSVSSTTNSATNEAFPNTYPEVTEAHLNHSLMSQPGFFSGVSSNEPVYFIAGGTSDNFNARFQLSFKYRLFEPEASSSDNFLDRLYFGYTQTSIWDIGKDSAPFRDTSYRPSFFWKDERLWKSADNRLFIGADAGYEHESNGKDGTVSRSLDMLYVRPKIQYRFDDSTLTFAPRARWLVEKSENPDIEAYRGYVDWHLRWAHDNGLIASTTLRQGYRHGSQQFDLAYPLSKIFNMPQLNGFLYMQYFQGYGLTLLEYNERAKSQVRFGLSIFP